MSESIKPSIFNNDTRSPEQAAYADLVDTMSQGKDFELSNGIPDHAAYLIHTLFKVSKHVVRLYSDHLTRSVSTQLGDVPMYAAPEILKQVKMFLSKPGVELKVVVENNREDWESHQLVKELSDFSQSGQMFGRAQIRVVSQDTLNWLVENEFENHFMVGDTNAYRMELDCTPTFAAKANFNDSKTSKQLINLFEGLHWTQSSLVKQWGYPA